MSGFTYGMVCSQCGAKGLTEVRVDKSTGEDWCIPCVDAYIAQPQQDELSQLEEETAHEKAINPEN